MTGQSEVARGRVFPPVPGLVVAEYAADGSVLQQSSAADADGAFTFPRALSGARVVALATEHDGYAPVAWASLVSPAQSRWVEITALTLMKERLVASGRAPSDADETVVGLIGSACGDGAARAVDASFADAAARPPDWLLRAVAAYIQALNDVGLKPDSAGQWTLTDLNPLLRRMCGVASDIASGAWLAALDQSLSRLGANVATADERVFAAARAHATEQVLWLVGTSAAVLVHPQLQPAFAGRLQAWQGRETDISLQVAIEKVHHLSAPSSLGMPADTAQALTITRTGEIWHDIGRASGLGFTDGTAWRISNRSAVDKGVRLSIGGVPLFGPLDLIDEMLRVPIRPGEGLHQHAWRFWTTWRDRAVPISGGRFQHQADLYLRSIGAGRCDDDAAGLRQLWAMLGYPARIWSLEGHIVPEVWVDGRWEMYDPHERVYYKTRDGRVAGVVQLQEDTSLISQPVNPNPEATEVAHIQEMADAYGPEGNRVMDWYSADPLQPMDNVFVVPAGGYVEAVAAAGYAFPSLNEPAAAVATDEVRVWFPPGYDGPAFALPLILADATGEGTLNLFGQDMSVTNEGIRAQLQAFYRSDPDVGVSQLRVKQVGNQGLTLTLLLNRKYFQRGGGMVATGPDLTGMTMETIDPNLAR